MTGCWLPRTTMPATGALAKRVVEGMAGMIGSSGKRSVRNIAVNQRMSKPDRAPSRDKPAPTGIAYPYRSGLARERAGPAIRRASGTGSTPPPLPAPAAGCGRPWGWRA
ncbi:hypothetical protein F6X59_00990 [Pseudomonas sp. MN1F]|nr:hypothetical protein [Pseudomonas sp. MN1F]